MLKRDDLYPLSLKGLDDFKRDGNARRYLMRVTSGTSRRGPLLMVIFVPPTASKRYQGAKRTIVCFGSYSAQLSNAMMFSLDAENNSMEREVLFLGEDDVSFSLEYVLNEFQPDTIIGVPSFLVRVLQAVHSSAALSRVATVRMSGEYLPATAEREIASRFPGASLSTFYAAAEVGSISSSIPCGFLPRNTYHPLENVIVKIADADAAGFGDILITKSISPSVYLEDYSIGDIGRLVPRTCPCGSPVTFEIAGRNGFDYIKFGSTVLRLEEFMRVAEELQEYLEDFRVELKSRFNGHAFQGEIRIKVIPRQPLLRIQNPEKFIAGEFLKKLFVTPTRTLESLTQSGEFLPLIVSLEREKFPYSNKGIRLIHLTQNNDSERY